MPSMRDRAFASGVWRRFACRDSDYAYAGNNGNARRTGTRNPGNPRNSRNPDNPVTPTTPTTPTTPAPSLTPAGVADFTTLDLGVIANYAAPVLPVYYDATVAAFDNTPTNNAINNRMATLGRVLFYDKRLSINDTISCASCHIQASGFSDPRRFSVGFAGALFTLAHSMRL